MKCTCCGAETKNWIEEDGINIPRCRECYRSIPGSELFRTFCSECRQPMLITDQKRSYLLSSRSSPKCNDCGNLKKIAANGTNLTARQKIGSGKTK